MYRISWNTWYIMEHMVYHGTHGISWNTWDIMEHMGYHGTHGISWNTWDVMEHMGYHGIHWTLLNRWDIMEQRLIIEYNCAHVILWIKGTLKDTQDIRARQQDHDLMYTYHQMAKLSWQQQ